MAGANPNFSVSNPVSKHRRVWEHLAQTRKDNMVNILNSREEVSNKHSVVS